MRKPVLVLVLLGSAAALGFVLASVGTPPVAGAVLGLIVVGGVAVTRLSTDRIMWLTACLFVMTVTWNGIRVGGGAFGNAFLALAVVSLVAHLLMSGRPLPLPPWLLLAGMGVFLSQLLTLVFPPDAALINKSDVQFLSLFPTPVYLPHRGDIGQLLKFEVSLVVVPVLMLCAGGTAARCRWLLDLFTFSAVVSGFVACVDYTGAVQLGPMPLVGTRASGLTIHPNYLALTSTVAIPLAMLWLNRASPRWRLAGWAAVPILVISVYASGSRAGAVTAVLAVIATGAVLPRVRRGLKYALPIAGMIAVFVLLFTGTGDHILEQVRLKSGGTDTAGSDFQRSYAANVAWEEIQARPLHGVGFAVIADAHDIYLELLAAGGAITLASFFLFIGGIATAARRAIFGPYGAEIAAASLAVALWLVNGILDNQVADKYLYVIPGILLALARISTRGPTAEDAPARPGRGRATPPPAEPAVEPPRVPVGV
jgi:hypothetical protein